MKTTALGGLCGLMVVGIALGQSPAKGSETITVRGCLQRAGQNLVLQNDDAAYVLRATGGELDGEVGHWLEVTGKWIPNASATARQVPHSGKETANSGNLTGSENAGTLRVGDVKSDVYRVADHCETK